LSRPTAPWRAGCWRRSNAGRSRSTIPAAMRSRIPPPGGSRGWRRTPRSAGFPRLRCSPSSSIRSRGSAPPKAPTRARSRRLETPVLRGPRPRPGTAGLAHALAAFRAELAKLRRGETSDLHPSDPRASLSAADLDAAAAFVTRLRATLAPLEGLASKPFADVAALHRSVIPALSADEAGAPAAFLGTDGAALDAAFAAIAGHGADADFAVAPPDYADVFRTAISDRVVRERELKGARVRIYGRLEARLQSVDRVVLDGLVEGVWPPEMRSDPWLSRPMRHTLGLDLPERRMSLSAHDFAQALGAHDVILAYPTKLAGAPTVISRFVQRLAAVAGEEHWNRARARGAKYLAW